MASAFYESCILFSSAEVGIYAALARLGRADVSRLAAELSADERGLRLLLDACVAIELLEKDGDLYQNTAEASAFLVPGAAADLSRAIRYNQDVYPAWGKLMNFARTGKPVEPPALHLGQDEERTRRFVLSMHGKTLGIGMAVLPHIDLSGDSRLLDIGAGPGTYSMLFARKYPHLQCTVLDLPEVVAIANQLIAAEGLAGRISAIAGDYHSAAFPGGHDAVHLFGMLHQESVETIRRILAKSFDALVPGGTVRVLDMMTDHTHTKPPFSALFAVNMALTSDHGWVFSDEELRGWMESAGFVDFQLRPLPPPMPHWLATARKPR